MTAAEIEDAVSGVGLEPLAAGVADKFQIYLDLLQKWNARLNLTAIRDPEEILSATLSRASSQPSISLAKFNLCSILAPEADSPGFLLRFAVRRFTLR
jgi:hypothetical protein